MVFEWNEDRTAFRVDGSAWVSVRKYLIREPGGLVRWLCEGVRLTSFTLSSYSGNPTRIEGPKL